MARPDLNFEGILGFSAADAEEAAHFFEHTLGLDLAGEEAGLRFYQLADSLTVTVDVGGDNGQPPYLLFSTPDVIAAAEHFLERGCAVRDLPWAGAAGFIATTPEGLSVAVIATAALDD